MFLSHTKNKAFVLTLCVLLCSPYLLSQPIEEQKQPVTIGIALSGGGAKGFAHIGVLKVLEEEGIPIQVVTGTSMGSIVGALYAIGYSPSMLEEIALRDNWIDFFNENPTREAKSVFQRTLEDKHIVSVPLNDGKFSLPRGFLEGQKFSLMLSKLTLPYHNVDDFTTFPIPFACVATNLRNGEGKRFVNGDLAQAIRASISFPSAFKPVKIGDETYIDGGLVRNLPVSDARDLGATFVIASDVASDLKSADSLSSFFDVMNQAMGFAMKKSDLEQIAFSDFYIRPPVDDYTIYDVGKVQELINAGEEATRKQIPELKKLLEKYSYSADQSRFKEIELKDIITFDEILIEGISGDDKMIAEQILNFKSSYQVSIRDLDKAIDKLYGTGLFNMITYRLQNKPNNEGQELVFMITSYDKEQFAFGARYDSFYKASLLFSLDLSSVFYENDLLFSNLRVGDQFQLKVNYFKPFTFYRTSGLNLITQVQRSPFNIYTNQNLSSSVNVEVLSLDVLTGLQFMKNFSVSAGTHFEAYNINKKVGETLLFEEINSNASVQILINGDTFDRSVYPTKGYKLLLKGEASQKGWDTSKHLGQLSFLWDQYVPLSPTFSMFSKIVLGRTVRNNYNIPLHYYYFAGGTLPSTLFEEHQFTFYGQNVQELRGPNIQYLQLGGQLNIAKDFYLRGLFNIANLSNTWDWDANYKNLEDGFGFSFGTPTVIGPVELILDGDDINGPFSLRINVGYTF